MKQLKSLFLSILCILNCTSILADSDIPSRPYPPRLVNDQAGILNYETLEKLEKMLVDYNDTTSSQICVVTLSSLNGYEASQMAQEIGESWGVGQKGENNGVVFLIVPKTEEQRGQAFIATGYGFEGGLPDVVCTRIINNIVIPYFKENDYDNGILAGVNEIMKYTSGEYSLENEADDVSDDMFYAVIIIFLIILVWGITSKGGGSSYSGGGSSYSGSGHSFGGGYSSGGFGGFGGGSFGGGGGGGSW